MLALNLRSEGLRLTMFVRLRPQKITRTQKQIQLAGKPFFLNCYYSPWTSGTGEDPSHTLCHQPKSRLGCEDY